MNVNDNDPKGALDTLTCIRGDDGRPVLMVGLLATLYFDRGWTRPVREAVTELAEQYLSRFRDQLHWAEDPSTGKFHPRSSIRRPSEWLPQHEDGEEWEFGFQGGESQREASPFLVKACSFGDMRPRPSLGFIKLHLPLNFFTEHGGTFVEFLLPLCARLKPISGIGGIGVLEAIANMAAGKRYPLVRELAEQYPGLDVHSGMLRHHVHEGIKGVNWLTILSDRWIQEMGGLDYLRVRLDEPTFPFYPYDGGVIIQAGPRPQIGDASKDLWPKDYITLHKVLKKIQVKDTYPFHVRFGGTTGEMDWDASRAWIFRFDGK